MSRFRSTTVQNLLFCAHTLCMNYATNKFLLVSSSVSSKQLLCFVHGQGQKSEQKHTIKNFVVCPCIVSQVVEVEAVEVRDVGPRNKKPKEQILGTSSY